MFIIVVFIINIIAPCRMLVLLAASILFLTAYPLRCWSLVVPSERTISLFWNPPAKVQYIQFNNNYRIGSYPVCVTGSPTSRWSLCSDESRGHNENTNHDDDDKIADVSDSDNVPLTPCNRICRYNKDFFDGQVCIGCFRETHEIASWASMGSTERYWTLLDAIDRMEEANDNGELSFDGALSKAELMRQAKFWKQQQK